MGAAWERHAMCESAFNVVHVRVTQLLLRIKSDILTSFIHIHVNNVLEIISVFGWIAINNISYHVQNSCG